MKQGTAQWLLATELQKQALAVKDKITIILIENFLALQNSNSYCLHTLVKKNTFFKHTFKMVFITEIIYQEY